METIPPDEQFEQAFVQCVLSDPLVALPQLKDHPEAAEYLADGRYRLIFNAAVDLTEAGELCAPPTIKSFLQNRNELFEGAESLIDFLFVASPASALTGYYAEKLRPLYKRREILARGQGLIQAAADGDIDLIRDKWQRLEATFADEGQAQNIHIEQLLTPRRFDPAYVPQAIQPVYSCAGVAICTRQNLTAVTAAPKVGKSAIVGGMIAGAMAISGSDTLSFASVNPDGRAVIHLDTEQSKDDHATNVWRAIHRAGREGCPDWLVSHYVAGFTVAEIQEALWFEAKRQAEAFGGIHSIFIDGVADTVNDVNDPEESNAWVARLHGLAIEYDCPIVTVIHLNPGSETKTRGHLGSQLERKAETNLRLDKDSDGVTTVWSDKQRRAPITKDKGPRFAWSDEARMHMSVAPGMSSKETAKRQTAIHLRDEAFNGRPGVSYTELEKWVQTATGKSESTAKRILNEWVHLDIVSKGFRGIWTPKD